MRITKINHIDEVLGQQILDLVGIIDDPEMDFNEFTNYFIANAKENGVFGAFDDDDLVAFIYAEPPTAIYPNRAYFFIAASFPTTPVSVSRELFEYASEWARHEGATYWWGWTERNPQVLERIYGFKAAKEKQIVCPLTDEWPNVRLENTDVS